MSTLISLIRGDGIGPEIVDETVRAIEVLDLDIEWEVVRAGAEAAREDGNPLPLDTLASIQRTGVALKGPLETPIGSGYRSINVALRKQFDLYANLRPAKSIEGISDKYDNVDLVTVRENTEGAYAGIEHTIPPNRSAAETIMMVTRYGSERIVRKAFDYARKNGRKTVTLVHKANILKETSGLFLEVGRNVAKHYDDVDFNDYIVDNMCMQLVLRPEQFDVIVTTNLFGDILSDLAAGLIGGLGLTPGANIGEKAAMFEAVHGTAPDIAGKGIANPSALMLSAAMMLEHLEWEEEAARLHSAVIETLEEGETLTGDLGGDATTREFTSAVISRLR